MYILITIVGNIIGGGGDWSLGEISQGPPPPSPMKPCLVMYDKITSPCPAHSLGEDDLKNVRKELFGVSSKWYDIGLELTLRTGDLENIRYQNPGDAPTCLREMLLRWLKQVDPPPTWEGLACALESPTVGEPRLAEQLRTQYCKTTQAAGQLSYSFCRMIIQYEWH